MDANGNWVTTSDQPSGVQLTDGVIQTNHLADGAVKTSKITDLNVTDAKILSLDASKLTGSLDGTIIEQGSITADKLSGTIDETYLDPDFINTVNEAYTIAGSKNATYYAPTAPAGSGHKLGDTWFDSSDGYKLYIWQGDPATWTPIQDTDIAEAKELAMGKNKITYSGTEPTSAVENDMWINTADGNKLYIFTGGDWVASQDADVAAAKAAADSAVTSYVIEYASNSSETVAPTTGWSTAAPTRTPGTFIWTRTKVTYGSGSTSTTNAVLVTGNTGLQGPAGYTPVKGTDYFDGADGQDGVSSYVWVRYGTSAAGAGMTTNPTGMTYIGVATTTTAVAPSTAGSYTWSLIKGDQGIQGETGSNGQTSYLHIKYSDNGTTFTANNGETPGAYIGTYVDFTAADSTSFSAYTWNLVKGPTGAPGTGISDIVEYYLATSSASGVTTATPGWTTTMQTMTPTNKYLWNYEVVNFTDSSSSSTIPVIIGTYGDQGAEGAPGRSVTAVTEYYLASASASGVTRATSGWTTTMQATTTTNKYLWNYEKMDWSSGTTPTYIEPIIIGVHGATGDTGPQGISVTSITPYYLQQVSATAPAKPTLATPPAPWQLTEPAYVAGQYLYRTEKVLYSNSSFAYTDVVKVSAYTAASLAMDAANSKNKNYYQASEPSGGTYAVGDTWFDTDNGNKPYIYNGSTWVANIDSSPGSPLAIANSKNRSYYESSQPTGGVYLKGDLWFDTSNNYRQYVYTGSAWQLAQDAYAAQASATTALQAANSKNKIVYSTLDPSGTGFVVGDMWYKTGTNATTSEAGVLTLYTYTKTSSNPDVFAWVAQKLTDSVLGNVSASKITVGTLNANLIAANTLNGDRITANTLTAAKLVTGTITAASGVIADAAITTAKIADLQVTDAKIGSVNASKIVAAWIEAGEIKANSIDGTAIKTNTLTTDQVTSDFGTDLDITSNTGVTVMVRKDNVVNAINVSTEGITINANRININGALQISNWAHSSDVTKIDGGDIYASSVKATQIAAGAITADKIQANAITADKLRVGDTSNIFADGGFTDTEKKNWTTAGVVTVNTLEPNWLEMTSINGSVTAINLNTIQVAEGEEIFASVDMFGLSTNAAATFATIKARVTKHDGTILSPAPTIAISEQGVSGGEGFYNRWLGVSGSFVVPAGASKVQLYLELTATVAGNKVRFRNARSYKKFSGQLIVDGTITTEHLSAVRINAGDGIIESLDASVITGGTISADLFEVVPASAIKGEITTSQLDPTIVGSLNEITNKADVTTVAVLNSQLASTTSAVDALSSAIVVDGNVSNAITMDSVNGIIIRQYTGGESVFSVKIDGDSIDFIKSGDTMASITAEKMIIASAAITGLDSEEGTGAFEVGRHKMEKSGEQTLFRWNG